MADPRCIVPERVKLHVAMLLLQFGYAGFHIVSRAALNMGISKVVFPIYRNIIALLLLGPAAYFFEKKERPPLTINFLVQFFLLALIGITANQGFYLLGLNYTSPTFASAIQNSVPAVTFVLAAALRLEQVHITRRDGLAKIFGTIACVGGATIITLYKGPPLAKFWGLTSHVTMEITETPELLAGKVQNWTLGCIYLIGNCLAWSGWIVIQAPVLRRYPARLSVTSFTCFFGIIQFLVIAAFIETDPARWQMHSGGEIFTVLYAGIVASGIAFSVQIWCIDRGGPVFVAVYQPIQTILVAIMAALILGESFYTGAIIGAILIIVGLYLVLWGKSEERRLISETKAASASLPAAQASIISSVEDHGDEEAARLESKSAAADLTQPLLHQQKHSTSSATPETRYS